MPFRQTALGRPRQFSPFTAKSAGANRYGLPMPLSTPDFERLFVPGTRHLRPGGDVVTVRLRRDAFLWLPTGRVVAGEPFMFGAMYDSDDGFAQRVPPGRYPLVLVLAVSGEAGSEDASEAVAAARLVIRDEPVVSWEMALREGQDVTELGDDEFFGYPVDGGTGGFIDAATIGPLCRDDDDYADRVLVSLSVRETDYTAAATLTDDEDRPLLVVFSSGGGDGHYPTWVGRTAEGEVACFLTDFFILTEDGKSSGDGPPGTVILPRSPDLPLSPVRPTCSVWAPAIPSGPAISAEGAGRVNGDR